MDSYPATDCPPSSTGGGARCLWWAPPCHPNSSTRSAGLGDIFPDNRRFGVVWMGERALAAVFRMEGAFNDAVLSLGPAASVREIVHQVDLVLAPYGGTGAYPRADQLSHRFVSSEIDETQVTSVLLPSIFLGVTAFLLHLVLSRVVSTQREQIAVLKAFGYSNRVVAVHYLQLATGPILIGTVLGSSLGLWLADGLASVYSRFYQFPDTSFQADWGVVALAFGVSAAAALFGAMSSVRRAVRVPPAEAMRPRHRQVTGPGLSSGWASGGWVHPPAGWCCAESNDGPSRPCSASRPSR